ncbi:MAG: phasin family protein [Pseudomonadales bacterium]
MADKSNEAGGPANPWADFDPAKWLEQFQLPGVDVSRLAESARKDLEALQKANQTAFEGWQALAEKQSEILRQTMETWQERVTEAIGKTPQENLEQQSEVARESFEKALANMSELTDLAVKSQTEAMEILRSRFEENLKTLFDRDDDKA